MRVRHIVICGLPGFTLPYYFKNSTIVEKKVIECKTCILIFWYSLQILCGTFPILRTTVRDVIKYVYWSSRTVPVILVFPYSTRYIGLPVEYPLYWSSRTVPVILVFPYSTRYIGLPLQYPLYWSSRTVPVILVFPYSTRYIGLPVEYPLYWSSLTVPVILVFP